MEETKNAKRSAMFEGFSLGGISLACGCCGADIMDDDPGSAVMQLAYDDDGNLLKCVPCHKEPCWQATAKMFSKSAKRGTIEVADLMNPYMRLRLEVALLRGLEADRKAAPEAAENLINAFIVTAPYVFREPMCHEREQYELSLEQIFE